MADSLFEVTMDVSRALGKIAGLDDKVESITKAEALETARAIQAEAIARVPWDTGDTSRGIIVEESYRGDGYVVISAREKKPGLPGWLEYGTRSRIRGGGTKKMAARPYLHPAAALEKAAWYRRLEIALGEAIKVVSR